MADVERVYERADERIDEIGFGGLKLIQKPKEFCYGVDAVILADFAAKSVKKAPELIIDLGTGTGVIPLILSYKTDAADIRGVEVQTGSWERAVRSAELNSLSHRLTFINGDIKDVGQTWGQDMGGQADVVVSNPPYFKSGGAIVNGLSAKAVARHETTADLMDFMRCAAYLLKPKGDFLWCTDLLAWPIYVALAENKGLNPKLCVLSAPARSARLIYCLFTWLRAEVRNSNCYRHWLCMIPKGIIQKSCWNRITEKSNKSTYYKRNNNSGAIPYEATF